MLICIKLCTHIGQIDGEVTEIPYSDIGNKTVKKDNWSWFGLVEYSLHSVDLCFEIGISSSESHICKAVLAHQLQYTCISNMADRGLTGYIEVYAYSTPKARKRDEYGNCFWCITLIKTNSKSSLHLGRQFEKEKPDHLAFARHSNHNLWEIGSEQRTLAATRFASVQHYSRWKYTENTRNEVGQWFWQEPKLSAYFFKMVLREIDILNMPALGTNKRLGY
jgi:hypothetical protein